MFNSNFLSKMKTITILKVNIVALFLALVICVLFGETSIGDGIASHGFLDTTGILILICSPICAVLVWLKKRIFVYIVALISGVYGAFCRVRATFGVF